MTRIKFCGFTNLEDAQNALNLGVDYLGFNFFEKSPRFITTQKFQGIWSKLDFSLNPKIVAVAVLVNPNKKLVEEILNSGIKILQFHGKETPQFCLEFKKSGIEIWKALNQDLEFNEISKYFKVDKILLDVSKKADFSSGKNSFSDFSKFIKVKSQISTILAGGLNPENIQNYLLNLKPEIVDVASGVEISPGKKDLVKMRQLLNLIENFNIQPLGPETS